MTLSSIRILPISADGGILPLMNQFNQGITINIGDGSITVFPVPPANLSMEDDAVRVVERVDFAMGRELWLASSWIGRKAYFWVEDGLLLESWIGVGSARGGELLQAMRAMKAAEAECSEIESELAPAAGSGRIDSV